MTNQLTHDILGATLITIAIGTLIGILSPNAAANFTSWTPYEVLSSVLLIRWGMRLMNEKYGNI